MTRQIDTDMVSLLKAMALEKERDIMTMVDVETNIPMSGWTKSGERNPDAFGRRRIFDFGYGNFNPFTGNKGNIKTNLVYEGFINPKVAKQILGWKKIYNAAEDSYYRLFNQLREHDWWADRVVSEEDIKRNINTRLFKESAQEKYVQQNEILREQFRVLDTWETERYHWKDAPFRRKQRRADIRETRVTMNKFQEWIKESKNLELLIENVAPTKNPSFNKVMSRVYELTYIELTEAHSQRRFESDISIIREIEKKMGTSFSKSIRRWEDTVREFDKSIRNNKRLLGITAYNIGHDGGSINDMNEDFGVDSKVGNLLSDDYRTICMENMVGMLRNQEAIKVINGIESFDEGAFEEGLVKALNKTGKLHTESFEKAYSHIMDVDDYDQKHTAKGDVLDQMDVFEEALRKYLGEFLNKRG